MSKEDIIRRAFAPMIQHQLTTDHLKPFIDLIKQETKQETKQGVQMNGKQVKELRSQIRAIVKELLPEILKDEVIETINKKLNETILARLNAIDERQKIVQDYTVRNSVRGITTPVKP